MFGSTLSDSLVDHNVIANNNGPGVVVGEADAQNNRISRNSIFANAGIGIDLFPAGSTPNDVDDADAGPNGLLNYPVLQRVTTKVVQGTACPGCLVELFGADSATSRPAGRTFAIDATADDVGAFSVSTTSFPEGALVTATATDPGGATSEFAPVATTVLHNDPPTVTPNGPFTVAEGATTSLSAVASDPDGDPVVIEWDLDGNGTFETPGSTVTFDAAGLDGPSTVTTRVRARDPRGAASTVTVPVSVLNAAPTATASAASSAAEGSNVVVSLSSPHDPSAADEAAGLRYAFSCDGTSISTSYSGAGTVPSVTCPVDDGPTTAPVRARVLDRDGGTTDYSLAVGVSNVAPSVSIAGTPSHLAEGATAPFTSTVTDPSSADTAAGFSYAWTGRVGSGPVQTASTPTFDFTPDDDGSAVVTLTATDKDGGSTTSTTRFPVTNVSPTATFTTQTTDAGLIATSTLRFTAPSDGAGDLAAGLHYAFSCDGVALTSSTYANSSTRSSTSCSWSDGASAHPVRARLIDKDGAWTEYGTDAVVGDDSPTVTADPASVVEGGSTTLTAHASSTSGSPTYQWDLDGDGSLRDRWPDGHVRGRRHRRPQHPERLRPGDGRFRPQRHEQLPSSRSRTPHRRGPCHP